MAPTLLPNPERDWERATHLAAIDRQEVERRIGVTDAPIALLSGGQANVNVRVADDRVLRIYRRDPSARAKEQALLERGWEWFVTPAILSAGDDFLLLEHVAHEPLHASAAHGAVVGRALAEIHRTSFDTAGLLDSTLAITHPFGDFADVFRSHARSELERATWVDASLRSAVDTLLAAHADAFRREGASPVLLHGDFKASNLHWTSSDRLLVLDWEFAYAGPALLDIGQLLRWHPASEFVVAFAESYQRDGGRLPADWQRVAELFDLVNLAGLAAGAAPDSPRATDIGRRLHHTCAA